MHTMEQLCELTNYKKNTLYNLCNDLDIDGVKGQIPGNPGKALYSQEDLDTIKTYQGLILSYIKTDAIKLTLEYHKSEK